MLQKVEAPRFEDFVREPNTLIKPSNVTETERHIFGNFDFVNAEPKDVEELRDANLYGLGRVRVRTIPVQSGSVLAGGPYIDHRAYESTADFNGFELAKVTLYDQLTHRETPKGSFSEYEIFAIDRYGNPLGISLKYYRDTQPLFQIKKGEGYTDVVRFSLSEQLEMARDLNLMLPAHVWESALSKS